MIDDGTILIAPRVVWLTRPPVGVVPRSAVGPPPGSLAYQVIRAEPRPGVSRDYSPHSGVLRGAVDACEIAAERLARCAPSRPRLDSRYVNEWRGRRWRRCPAPRAHHRDERGWRARQAAAEPHAIQLRRAEGDVPHQQVLHLAREHRVVTTPVALAHVQVGAAHRQREAHRRRRRDAHTVPVDLGGPVGVGEARTRLHDRDVSPHVCGE